MDTTMATTQTQVTVFTNEQFGEIRTLIRDGEPWFVAPDVCKALEIRNTSDALSRLDDDEKMTIALTEGHSGKRGGAQFLTIVNEAGLYVLILSSRKKEAKAFKRWIVHEVLPKIRKTGVYMTHSAAEKLFTDPNFLVELATKFRDVSAENAALVKQNAALNGTIASLQPKAEYFDQAMSSNKLYTVEQIAADYGYKAPTFNWILHNLGIQYKVGGQWILARQYVDRGWTKSVTHVFKHKDGTPGTNALTKWTEKGRYGLYETFKRLAPFVAERAERWFAD